MKYVIIGNSAAGTAAIEAIRKYDNRSSIVQLTDENRPLYSRCLISYYVAGKIDVSGRREPAIWSARHPPGRPAVDPGRLWRLGAP